MGNYVGKRKLSDTDSESSSPIISRKKLRSTSDYIYSTLFVGGENSDVTLCALGHEWKLHKVYLKQSGYFQSMFSGRWKEFEDTRVNIEIIDANIDIAALDKAFESLYRDNILLEVNTLVSVLAAASLLQLEALVEECSCMMKQNINSDTVSSFYSAANEYAQLSLQSDCVRWLQLHLCTCLDDKSLSKIRMDFLQEVLSSSGLFVVHVELDVYVVVRKWTYSQLVPDAVEKSQDITTLSASYFRSFDTNQAFLERPEGAAFHSLFRCLRLEHIINDNRNIQLLERDHIIPLGWLLPVFKRNWEIMLYGGMHSEEDFDSSCLRCGRILYNDTHLTWRWTGFSFGFDVLVTYSKAGRLISFKRNAKIFQTRFSNSSSFICMHPKRSLRFRLSVVSFDGDGREIYFKSTDLQEYAFNLNQEIVIMSVDEAAQFPLHFSLNLAFGSVVD